MADRDRPLVQLVSVRFKEYTREPEALFWSFGFPILLALGLGIAFRAKPADVVHVAVTGTGPAADRVEASLRKDAGLAPERMSADSAGLALRSGRIAVVVQPAGDSGVTYEYDDTRPDARTARLMVDQDV